MFYNTNGPFFVISGIAIDTGSFFDTRIGAKFTLIGKKFLILYKGLSHLEMEKLVMFLVELFGPNF